MSVPAPTNNAYDIYNAFFTMDQPIVSSIVTAILDQLQVSVASNLSTFDFSLIPFTGTLPLLQQNRVNERVLCILRAAGIRCQMKVTPLTPQDPVCDTPYSGAWFNGLYSGFNLITITFYSRNVSEYLRTFC